MLARVVQLHDLECIDAAGVHLRPIRRTLGISAFGTNAYSNDAGEVVVEPHDERHGGHEELHVVISGQVQFVIEGDAISASAGTLIFVPPALHRQATATADGTTVMAIGGLPGAAGPISAWEWVFAAAPHKQAGDWKAAYRTAARALEDHPRDGNTCTRSPS